MRIVDESGNEVPPGVAGEIVVRSRPDNATFSGYYDMSDRHRGRLAGWLVPYR